MEPGETIEQVAKSFNLADSVNLTINDMDYSGEIIDLKIGEYIIFVVKNMDNNLLQIPAGYQEAFFKVFSKKGAPKIFPTVVLNKKLPRLLLKFPDSEVGKIIRFTQRAHTNLKTPIFLLKREKYILQPSTFGLGTLTNMSRGGCSITTNMELEKGDKINCYLEVLFEMEKMMLDLDLPSKEVEKMLGPKASSSDKRMLELTGIVRNKRDVSDGVIGLGVQFTNLDDETKNHIKSFMERRKL